MFCHFNVILFCWSVLNMEHLLPERKLPPLQLSFCFLCCINEIDLTRRKKRLFWVLTILSMREKDGDGGDGATGVKVKG